MTSPTNPLARYPLTAFVVLACGFAWMFTIAHALGAGIEAGQFPLGPIIAAAIVSAASGRAALKRWGRRLLRTGASPAWYLVAVLAPVAIIAAAVLVNSAFGAPLPTYAQVGQWTGLGGTFVVMLIFIGIGEEAGWTAFAAPALLERYRFLLAWVVLGAIRSFWHLPMMLQGDLSWTLGVGGNFAFQFLALWLFRRTGAWFLVAVWHATLNTVSGSFLFPMAQGADQSRLGTLMVAGYWIAALAVLVLDRRRLQLHEPPPGQPQVGVGS